MRTQAGLQLAISVGGTKVSAALVRREPLEIVARSGRVEWSREGVRSVEAFMQRLAEVTRGLLERSRTRADEIAHLGVAWPGPGKDGQWEATFIPGCKVRQPMVALLRRALVEACGPAFDSIPITVVLDVMARAAGETEVSGGVSGALATQPGQPAANALMVNIATGIAGAVMRRGQVLLSHPSWGESYGQFGRFLWYHPRSGHWRWRPTPDGSMPAGEPGEIRWTRLSAGPALAQRIAVRWLEQGLAPPCEPGGLAGAVAHYGVPAPQRDPGLERALLVWCSEEARREPDGFHGRLLVEVADEIAGALRTLLRVAFPQDEINRLVLAGGVGENFGRGEPPDSDLLTCRIQEDLRRGGRPAATVVRATLGVDAEFLGFASRALPASSDLAPEDPTPSLSSDDLSSTYQTQKKGTTI